MIQQHRLGSAFFGAGMVGFGLLSLIRRDDIPAIAPLPAGLPGRVIVAMLVAAVLVAAGGALIANWRAARAASALGAVLAVWLVALHLPKVVANPKNGGAWVVFWEVMAMGVAAWMIARATSAREDGATAHASRATLVATGLRIAFGLSFVAFGISHFVYVGYVVAVIPAWIPARTFFAYATGVAHIAAGCSLLTRVQERMATALLSVMFGSWVLVLHIPRALASPGSGAEWSSLFVALTMCGGAVAARSFLMANSAERVVSSSGSSATVSMFSRPKRARSSRHEEQPR